MAKTTAILHTNAIPARSLEGGAMKVLVREEWPSAKLVHHGHGHCGFPGNCCDHAELAPHRITVRRSEDDSVPPETGYVCEAAAKALRDFAEHSTFESFDGSWLCEFEISDATRD
jgi:hypothetical protein